MLHVFHSQAKTKQKQSKRKRKKNYNATKTKRHEQFYCGIFYLLVFWHWSKSKKVFPLYLRLRQWFSKLGAWRHDRVVFFWSENVAGNVFLSDSLSSDRTNKMHFDGDFTFRQREGVQVLKNREIYYRGEKKNRRCLRYNQDKVMVTLISMEMWQRISCSWIHSRCGRRWGETCLYFMSENSGSWQYET